MSNRPAKPESFPWLSPYLMVKDVAGAIKFYQEAFGFELKDEPMKGPDGTYLHAELKYRDAVIMCGSENACDKLEMKAPITNGTTPGLSLYVYVDDVNEFYKNALKSGAKSISEPEDKFYGDRSCMLRDLDGHVWGFATNVADFDPDKVPAGSC